MKHTILITVLIITTHCFTHIVGCDIRTTAHWEEFGNKHKKRIGNPWIFVGSITFHKTSTEPIKLEQLILAWHGPHINHLNGSLFKKLPNKPFFPIEEQFICDSTWNKVKQELIFDLKDKRQALGPNSIFNIILVVQKSVEPILKSGHLSLAQTNLPSEWCTEKNKDLTWATVTN